MVISAVVLDLEAEKLLVEDALRNVLQGGHCPGASGVAHAMEYSVLGGGQRLRPLLAVRVGKTLGADPGLVVRGGGGGGTASLCVAHRGRPSVYGR
jgi:geranylgeranyl pyrophosphate synthase